MVERRPLSGIKKSRLYLIAGLILCLAGFFVWDIVRSVRPDEDAERKEAEKNVLSAKSENKVQVPAVVNAQTGNWDDPSLELWQKQEPPMPSLSPDDRPEKHDPTPDESDMRRLKEMGAVPN